MKNNSNSYNFCYRLGSNIFHFIFHYKTRKLYTLAKADYVYRVHNIAGVADLIYHCHSDVIQPLLLKYGAKIGGNFFCKSQIKIEASIYGRLKDFSNLQIGNNVTLTKGIYLDLTDKIIIEDNVIISPEVKILTHASVANKPLRHFFPEKLAPVVIQQGAWIGAGAIILSGTNIGKYSVVGAGSVVTKNVPSLTVVAGSPAREIKKLPYEPEYHLKSDKRTEV